MEFFFLLILWQISIDFRGIFYYFYGDFLLIERKIFIEFDNFRNIFRPKVKSGFFKALIFLNP